MFSADFVENHFEAADKKLDFAEHDLTQNKSIFICIQSAMHWEEFPRLFLQTFICALQWRKFCSKITQCVHSPWRFCAIWIFFVCKTVTGYWRIKKFHYSWRKFIVSIRNQISPMSVYKTCGTERYEIVLKWSYTSIWCVQHKTAFMILSTAYSSVCFNIKFIIIQGFLHVHRLTLRNPEYFLLTLAEIFAEFSFVRG